MPSVYGIIHTWANDELPHICVDFIQLLPFKCFQVETGTQFEDIFGKNDESYKEGDCQAGNWSIKCNPH